MPFSQDWFSHNIPTWTQHLAKFIDQPVKALEIGCFEGQATKWLLDHILTNKDARITCLDTFAGSEEHTNGEAVNLEQRFWDNLTPYLPKVMTIRGKSQVTIRQTMFGYDYGTEMFDEYSIIYIDGSHKASDVLEDAVLCHRLLIPGGIMIFDDYKWLEYQGTLHHPAPAIDAFLYVFGGQYKLLHKDYQVIVEKL